MTSLRSRPEFASPYPSGSGDAVEGEDLTALPVRVVAPVETGERRDSYPGVINDLSGTIATGGTSQRLCMSNRARRYLVIVNLSNTETLWLRPGPRAAVVGGPGMWPLNQAGAAAQGGGVLVFENTAIAMQEWQIVATTTGHAFTAYEM